MSTRKCEGCGERTRAAGSFCRSCQVVYRRSIRRITSEGLLLDSVGTIWCVWDAKGEVLAGPCDTRTQVILALGDSGHEMNHEAGLE